MQPLSRVGILLWLIIIGGLTACAHHPLQDSAALAVSLPDSATKPLDIVTTLRGDSVAPVNGMNMETSAAGSVPKILPKTQVFPGTGIFMNKAWAPSANEPAGTITLNFEDTDVREVVKVILGDMLGVNYTIDPGVKGSVSLQNSRPLTQGDLLPMLESLLRMNGAVVNKEGDLYRIVPMAAGAVGGTPQLATRFNFLPQGYSVVPVPLRYISVSEMEKILKPLAPQNAILYSDPVRNLLMVAGTGNEIKHLLETIEMFDVNWMAGMSVGLFKIESVDAKTISDELEKLLNSKQGPLNGLIRVLPIERMNSLLVVTPQRAYLNEVGTWIERLDKGGYDGGEQRLFVYNVQNTKAEYLANVLNEVFGNSGGSSSKSKAPKGKVAPGLKGREIGTGSSGSSGNSGNMESDYSAYSQKSRNSSATPKLPASVPGSVPGSTPVSTTTPASIEIAGGNSGGVAGENTASSSANNSIHVGDNVRIIADDTNNALLILATERDYGRIITAVKQLDVMPLQVLIEASIVEIKLTDDLKYGLQWFFNDKIGGKIGTSSLDGSIDSSTASGLGKIFPGFNYTLTDSANQVRAVLSTLASDSKVNVLSSPSIMVLDNTTAEIQVGDEVPISTQQQQSTSTASANIINSIEYRKTGVGLSVTPRVNSSGLVTMEIAQDVSNVAKTTTSGLDSPTINNRTINSTIVVQSGETIVLGGLIREDKSRTKSGIPVLYNMPVVGNLFGQTETKVDRTELIILITPRVVGSVVDARQVTQELRDKLQGLYVKPAIKPAAVPSAPAE